MQHPLRDVGPAHDTVLEASFRHHSVFFSLGLIFVTAVQPSVEPFHRLDPLSCTKEMLMVLGSYCRVGVVTERHRLKVLRSVHESIDTALQAMWDQSRVNYIRNGDDKMLPARKAIMLGPHNNSYLPRYWATSNLLTLSIAS